MLLILPVVFLWSCGGVEIPEEDDVAGPLNTACLDDWSLVHLGTGVMLGQVLGKQGWEIAESMLLGWEVVEPHVWPGFDESLFNQQCDIVVGSLGYLLRIFLVHVDAS